MQDIEKSAREERNAYLREWRAKNKDRVKAINKRYLENIDIQDVNTKKKRALMIKSPLFDFQIYNKALESENKHPYSRFEFRFKNVNNNDIYSLTERLQRLIEDMTDNIQTIEKQRINDLHNLWIKESNIEFTTQTKNFSEFIRRYSNDEKV